MPCFHFDRRGEALVHPGLNLPGLTEARTEAVRLAGNILGDEPQEFLRRGVFELDVRNCQQQVLFTIYLGCRDGELGARPAEDCPDGESGLP